MKYFVAAFFAALFISSSLFAYDPVSFPTQNRIPVNCNFGPKAIATPTIEIDDKTIVNLSDYLPEGTLGFELRAASGSFVFGHQNTIATGSAEITRTGRLIEEGEVYIWNGYAGLASNFTGAVVCNVGSGILKIDNAWGWKDD